MKNRLEAGEDPLELSIEKWLDIAAGENVNVGPANCALCHLYLSNHCEKCPVFIHTKQRFCQGTPYFDAYEHKIKHFDTCMTDPKFHRLALKEAKFLLSLRQQKKADQVMIASWTINMYSTQLRISSNQARELQIIDLTTGNRFHVNHGVVTIMPRHNGERSK